MLLHFNTKVKKEVDEFCCYCILIYFCIVF